MKVKCTVTLDIDPDSYADEYGVEGAAAIRADLQQHVQTSMCAHFETVGILRCACQVSRRAAFAEADPAATW